MNKITLTLLVALSSLAAIAQTKKPAFKKAPSPVPRPAQAAVKATPMKTGVDSASYAFGMIMATNLKSDGLKTLNYDLLLNGLKDAFNSQKPALSKEDAQSAINSLFKAVSAEKNQAAIAKGKAFFAKNKQVPGVITTASGLQYQVIKAGKGAKPGPDAKVRVHYKGTLLDGTTFDSSYDREEPVSLSVGNVIQGWTEALQLMEVGSHYKLFIPYQLAYGERAASAQIPAYSDLIFEIELLEIEK